MQNYKIKRFNLKKLGVIVSVMLFFSFQHVLAQSEKQTLKTVCIDAGHGGHDPGCHGGIANEKTVCLSMALKLGKLIKEHYPDVKVIYTREKDVFVELDERAKIANRNKADLFICIHANSASPAAYGAETYVLGLHRTESQLKIAEKENSSIYLEDDGGAKYKDFDMSPDAIIFKQLQMSVYLDLAIKFAGNIQTEFKKLGRYDRGVKQAGFIVLYKTTMPSVLIETGFLTNPTEERFLADEISQQKMADAMFVAFQKYKNELDGVDVMKGVSPTKEYKQPEKVEEPNVVKDTKEPKNAPVENSDLTNKVVYRVQIVTSSTRLSQSAKVFNALAVFEYFQDGLYKYTTGEFVNDFKAANELKNQLREGDYKSAFVVAFYNGDRISLDEALKRAK
ncbi:MAG TPA: N-acetylmuramoyl-L-alanine amidase [Crocinitomicaceae bacterium]|nr:N-acetylmuramoyl-L-alanine amidase [Crocinitomicaceae bacterium]